MQTFCHTPDLPEIRLCQTVLTYEGDAISYRKVLKWTDGSIAQYKPLYKPCLLKTCCGSTYLKYDTHLSLSVCVKRAPWGDKLHALCEIDLSDERTLNSDKGKDVAAAVILKEKETHCLIQNNTRKFPITAVTCQDGHITHDFLVCDPQTRCGIGRDGKYGGTKSVFGVDDTDSFPCQAWTRTSFSALFTCNGGRKLVSYSLVCDYRPDCTDNSDEDFCIFPHCSLSSHHTCSNKQCIALPRHCDGFADCVDESDESDCEASIATNVITPAPPLLANFDGKGDILYTSLNQQNPGAACPESHFLCPGNEFCLPVYVICNGVKDCPGHEDEFGCSSYECPGFYRCRGFLFICLHPEHVCDGWSQCPQHDDERFCHLTCPDTCMCLGHSFRCNGDFQVEQYARLRYLDAGGSGLTASRLFNNSLLVYLSLSRCNLTNIHNLSLPNVRTLDLSDNMLTVIAAADFSRTQNLRTLSIARNPLSVLFPIISNNTSFWWTIFHLDLSGVEIETLDVRNTLPFPNLLSLNLSKSGVSSLLGDGFQLYTFLAILDARECSLANFPRAIFSGLNNLKQVYADNFKICCPITLPDEFNVENCQAPFGEISSCDDLLRSDVYRGSLSIFAILAVAGNLSCFLIRVFALRGRGKNGFNVFVVHLSVSDFLMGVYLVIIGIADYVYRGNYLWEDRGWKTSTVCKVAGLLSFMSNEVSAIMICLITLDRFLAICFPFQQLRFSQSSAHFSCFCTWIAGVFIATFPLLPVTAYWQFYSQTGICIPLPITRNDFAGHDYAFGIMIIFNMVIFLLIALGQIFIYMSMTANTMSSVDTRRQSRDFTVARRLITVVISDFCCWFPLGLLGVLSSQGVSISQDINVGMAIFVLPLNAAINPFLYTLNMLQERQRRADEKQMLQIILKTDHLNKNIY